MKHAAMKTLVHSHRNGPVATITLDSLANRNALSAALCEQLHAAIVDADVDPGVRIIVLSHTGPVFCAGADLREAAEGVIAPVGAQEIIKAIVTSRKPVIARLAGPARAGGLGLAAACDIAIVSRTASFAFSEVRLGVIPAVISLIVVPRLGVTRSAQLFLTGSEFSATDAVRWGLFTNAVSPKALDDEVRRHVEWLAAGEPDALGATKQLLADLTPTVTTDRLDWAADLSARWFRSPGAAEGMTAFKEHRRPAWVPPSRIDWAPTRNDVTATGSVDG